MSLLTLRHSCPIHVLSNFTQLSRSIPGSVIHLRFGHCWSEGNQMVEVSIEPNCLGSTMLHSSSKRPSTKTSISTTKRISTPAKIVSNIRCLLSIRIISKYNRQQHWLSFLKSSTIGPMITH